MGYYTFFTLTKLKGDDKDYDNLVKDIKDKTGLDLSEEQTQEAKWYDCEHDMERLTRKYPGLIVELHGNGETADDLWAMRFRNGKSERVSYIKDDIEFEEIVDEDDPNETNKSLDVICKKCFEANVRHEIASTNIRKQNLRAIKAILTHIYEKYDKRKVGTTFMHDEPTALPEIIEYVIDKNEAHQYIIATYFLTREGELQIGTYESGIENVQRLKEDDLTTSTIQKIFAELSDVVDLLEKEEIFFTPAGNLYAKENISDVLEFAYAEYIIKDGRYFRINNTEDMDDIDEVPFDQIKKIVSDFIDNPE